MPPPSNFWPAASASRRGLVHDLPAEVDGDLVVERQRAHRHAGVTRAVLDHGGRDALLQHAMALADEGAADARGEEAAAVVHDDRRLADLLHVVQRPRERLLRGLLADNDLDQRHLLDRREEMETDELVGPRRGLGEAGDRQRRGVRCEHGGLRQRSLGLLGGLGLHFAILEHRLDHEVAVLERAEVRRRRDLGQHRIGLRLVEALALHQLSQLVSDVRLALVGRRLVAVDQHDVEPGLHRDGGDARAHQAGAQHADLLVLLLRHALGPADQLVGFLQAEDSVRIMLLATGSRSSETK